MSVKAGDQALKTAKRVKHMCCSGPEEKQTFLIVGGGAYGRGRCLWSWAVCVGVGGVCGRRWCVWAWKRERGKPDGRGYILRHVRT